MKVGIFRLREMGYGIERVSFYRLIYEPEPQTAEERRRTLAGLAIRAQRNS